MSVRKIYSSHNYPIFNYAGADNISTEPISTSMNRLVAGDQPISKDPVSCRSTNLNMLPLAYNLPILTPRFAMVANRTEFYNYLNTVQTMYNPNLVSADSQMRYTFGNGHSICSRTPSPAASSYVVSSPVRSPSPSTGCSSSSSSSFTNSTGNNNNNNEDSSDNEKNRQNRGENAAKCRSRKFECLVCHKSFGYKHVLANHERIHTGEKPFSCTQCDKKFTRDHHLKTHMRMHTGERPYECKQCNKKFVQVANLNRHLKVHLGPRPFPCDFQNCRSRFFSAEQLTNHKQIHDFSNSKTELKEMENSQVGLHDVAIQCLSFLPNQYSVKEGPDAEEEPQDLSIRRRRSIDIRF